MNRLLIICAAFLAMGLLSWYFPLFQVVQRGALQAERNHKRFNAAEYVQEFWKSKLIPSFDDATDVEVVLSALRADPEQARTQFGRTLGVSRSSLYYVRGKGTIVSVDDRQIGVSTGRHSGTADFVLVTGPLFGNIVRDATGLLNGDVFSNSEQFNEISSKLNQTIEEQVVPSLRKQAVVGATIEFVGCVEVTNLPRDILPLKVVPLDAHLTSESAQ